MQLVPCYARSGHIYMQIDALQACQHKINSAYVQCMPIMLAHFITLCPLFHKYKICSTEFAIFTILCHSKQSTTN